MLASLLFFSTPSISDDPYYSDVNYCDIYAYCDNPDLDPNLDDDVISDEPDWDLEEFLISIGWYEWTASHVSSVTNLMPHKQSLMVSIALIVI